MEPYDLTIMQAVHQIQARKLSAVELVQSFLDRIQEVEPSVGAWETLDAEGALAVARRCDSASQTARQSALLHGIPLGIKDIFYTRGIRTAAGFPPFADFIPDRDATAVGMLRAAGAIILGKTVTTQFAQFDPAETRNPWDLERTPGGSSSGSAAAVATRMVPGALGSQTGGSTLRPAGYCGVVGFKPTYGRISCYGVLPAAWSLDHVGIIVRSVEDAALLLQVLAGYDSKDPASARRPVPRYVDGLTGSARPPRLGLLADFLAVAEPDVRAHALEVAAQLEQAGARVREVRLPVERATVLAVHHVIMQSETAAAHAQLHRQYPEAYRPKLRASIEVGQLIPAAAYVHAQRVRRRIRSEVDRLLRGLDGLLAPAAPNLPPDLSTTGDASFQSPWSLVGLPAISIPTGLSDAGLPFATQVVGQRFAEQALLRLACWCEGTLLPGGLRWARPAKA